MILGLLLGASVATYLYLPAQAIGFAFPNINGELSVKPTFIRLLYYLCGRWLGFCILGILFGLLGLYANGPVMNRLALSGTLFFTVYMLLFVIINHSPEFGIVKKMDPSTLSLPIVFKGLLSAGILLSPLLVAMCLIMLKYKGFSGMTFTTFMFIGNTLVSLPLLLNMKWIGSHLFRIFLKIILLCSTGLVVYFYGPSLILM